MRATDLLLTTHPAGSCGLLADKAMDDLGLGDLDADIVLALDVARTNVPYMDDGTYQFIVEQLYGVMSHFANDFSSSATVLSFCQDVKELGVMDGTNSFDFFLRNVMGSSNTTSYAELIDYLHGKYSASPPAKAQIVVVATDGSNEETFNAATLRQLQGLAKQSVYVVFVIHSGSRSTVAKVGALDTEFEHFNPSGVDNVYVVDWPTGHNECGFLLQHLLQDLARWHSEAQAAGILV